MSPAATLIRIITRADYINNQPQREAVLDALYALRRITWTPTLVRGSES